MSFGVSRVWAGLVPPGLLDNGTMFSAKTAGLLLNVCQDVGGGHFTPFTISAQVSSAPPSSVTLSSH